MVRYITEEIYMQRLLPTHQEPKSLESLYEAILNNLDSLEIREILAWWRKVAEREKLFTQRMNHCWPPEKRLVNHELLPPESR